MRYLISSVLACLKLVAVLKSGVIMLCGQADVYNKTILL